MDKLSPIIQEVEKAVTGKREVIEGVLMALLCRGHVLLDDVPGVGKTTLALALSRSLGLRYRRIQFTPDVLPSDIVGFSMVDRQTGALRFVPGVLSGTNLLLGDEINRTSSKTQSALLEAMEENQITVDGQAHPLEQPFCVIATQNRVGTAGTQPLPQAQMDRFLVQLSLGYPDHDSEMAILRDRTLGDPLQQVRQAASVEEVLHLQSEAMQTAISDHMLDYITRLCAASREDPALSLGISPRGALSVSRMARACASVRGRDYVIVEDVQQVFLPTCAHRVLLSPKARMEGNSAQAVLQAIVRQVKLPHGV